MLPDFATHQVLVPVFPCVAPPSPLAPFLVIPQLPVWPSTRLPWPPQVSLRGCRGVGAAWVRCRERHRQDLPGGRRTRVYERVRAGFGSRTVQPPRCLEVVADGLSLFGGAQLAIDTTLVSALRRDGTAREGEATQLSSTVPASSGAVREVHQDGVVPPRIGRRVVLVPGSPDATPSSLMSNRFAVLADEDCCEESPRVGRRPSRLVIVSQDRMGHVSEFIPTVTQPAVQHLPTWKDSSEEGSRDAEVSHPSAVEAADTHCGSTWPASGEALRRMERFARADTQVDSAEDDSPGASAVSGAEEFDLTAVREMECQKSMQVTFHHQCMWKMNRTPCQPASLREKGIGQFGQYRFVRSFCKEGSGHEGPTEVLEGCVLCSTENGDD